MQTELWYWQGIGICGASFLLTHNFVVQLPGGPAGGGVSRRPPVGLHQGTNPGRPGLQHDVRRSGEPGDCAEVRECRARVLKNRPQLSSVP